MQPRAAVERLEGRSLLAAVPVADFGAVPNDGLDDRAAVLAAVAASRPGDTVVFAAGTYDLSDEITLTAGRDFRGQGAGKTVLKGVGREGHLLRINGDRVSLRGFTVSGGGLFMDKPGGGFNDFIDLSWNRFETDTKGRGPHRNGITYTSGLAHGLISNNVFTGTGWGLYGYNYSNVQISNNEFVNVAAGMHIDAFTGSVGIDVEQNLFSGVRGMGVEMQSSATNVSFYDNYYERPALGTEFRSNDSTFAYSLILDKSSNIDIRRNTVLAPERPDGVGVRIGFEVGGDNTVVTDNFVDGINHVVAANDGVGTTSVSVYANSFQNYLQGVGGRGLVRNENNALRPDQLTWDTNRGKPGVGRRVAIDKAGTLTPNPGGDRYEPPGGVVEPPPPPPQNVTHLSDLAPAKAENGWGVYEKDRSNGEQGASDGKAITLNGQTYAKGLGVHAGSRLEYNLNGQYATFRTDIGLDDEVGTNGRVVFEVWVDGAKKYDSGAMTGATATKTVEVDVAGAKQLWLVVTDGGDGKDFDHADWANARLTKAAQQPPPDDDERAKKIAEIESRIDAILKELALLQKQLADLKAGK